MSMRVSTGTLYHSMTADLMGSATRLQAVQAQLATGKRVNTVADSPSDAVSLMRLDAQSADLDSFDHSATDATAWLSTQDQALQSASGILGRVRDLASTGISGAQDQSSREALAQEVDALRDQLADTANTSYLGRSVFGGFADQAVTKSGAGYAFTGDGGQVRRQIAPTLTVAVNVDGKAAFGFGAGDDAFTVLSDVAANLRAGNTAGLQGDLTRVDARTADVNTALEQVGTTSNQVSAVAARGQAMKANLATARAGLGDVDFAKAAMDLQLASNGYQAALGAASKANLPSLADYLH